MGRMSVGRFESRATALDYLVEKYSREERPARYVMYDDAVARIVFIFDRDFGDGNVGQVSYTGNGMHLSAAVVDLFKQLSEEI